MPSHFTRRHLLQLGVATALAPALLTTEGAAAEDLEITVAEGLTIKRRASWAGISEPPKGDIPVEDVRFLLVHHTADRFEHAREDVPNILRGYYGFHTSTEKGWPDIAYNFMIDRFGQVWETHAGSVERGLQGYATGGNQGFSQLVCLIGDFSTSLPTEAALDSLTKTLAWLANRDGIDTQPSATATFTSRGSNLHPVGTAVTTPTITGHREMSNTSCPGDAFFPYVQSELPALVTAQRGPSRTPTTATPTSTTVVPTSAAPPPTQPPTTVTSSTQAAPMTANEPVVLIEEESTLVAPRSSETSVARGLLAFGAVGTIATSIVGALLYRRARLTPGSANRLDAQSGEDRT